MSSGEVSSLTKITDFPALPNSSAFSAENTTTPQDAPGPAGNPEPIALTPTRESGSMFFNRLS